MEYSIGQLAKISGSTARAIRIYEKKGLLHGTRNESNQYRVFDENALVELQRIQMLKFLGFSLEQIKSFLQQFENQPLKQSFCEQKRLLEHKKNILESMSACVDRAINECESKSFTMDDFFTRINHIQKNQKADDLVRQLSRFSKEPEGWSRWIFDQAALKPDMKILDAGAGWGNLWRYNSERIAPSMQVTCIDQHNTHADSFSTFALQNKMSNFDFVWDDLESIKLSQQYDRIFFNHVILFINDPISLYRKFKKSLSQDGVLVCTWGGNLLFENYATLLSDYAPISDYYKDKCKRYEENLNKRVEDLKKIFRRVECRKYILNLQFGSAEEFADYILMHYKSRTESEEVRLGLIHFLENKFDDKEYTIERDTYLFLCS